MAGASSDVKGGEPFGRDVVDLPGVSVMRTKQRRTASGGFESQNGCGAAAQTIYEVNRPERFASCSGKNS